MLVNYTIIGSDNGLSPVWRQPIIWTNGGLLSIRPQETYFLEILFEIQKFSFKNMYMKMMSAKMAAILSWPQCVKALWDSTILWDVCHMKYTWPDYDGLWSFSQRHSVKKCLMSLDIMLSITQRDISMFHAIQWGFQCRKLSCSVKTSLPMKIYPIGFREVSPSDILWQNTQ